MDSSEKVLITVSNGKFKPGDTIILDGRSFIGCTFDGCMIRYSGGLFEMRDCLVVSAGWSFGDSAQRVLNLLRYICDENPESRSLLFPNWKRWKPETVH